MGHAALKVKTKYHPISLFIEQIKLYSTLKLLKWKGTLFIYECIVKSSIYDFEKRIVDEHLVEENKTIPTLLKPTLPGILKKQTCIKSITFPI